MDYTFTRKTTEAIVMKLKDYEEALQLELDEDRYYETKMQAIGYKSEVAGLYLFLEKEMKRQDEPADVLPIQRDS